MEHSRAAEPAAEQKHENIRKARYQLVRADCLDESVFRHAKYIASSANHVFLILEHIGISGKDKRLQHNWMLFGRNQTRGLANHAGY